MSSGRYAVEPVILQVIRWTRSTGDQPMAERGDVHNCGALAIVDQEVAISGRHPAVEVNEVAAGDQVVDEGACAPARRPGRDGRLHRLVDIGEV
jgi:hypothetical protein